MLNVDQVVNWLRVENNADLKLSDSTEELTQMKAMKLLYYIQDVCLTYLGKKMFREDIIASKSGPIVNRVHQRYKAERRIVGYISDSDIKDFRSLNDNQEYAQILATVYKDFGHYSTYDLTEMTRSESPWKRTELNAVITDQKMIEYFSTVVSN